WQGSADPPLTDTGRAQALAAARQLGDVEHVWASDLERAAETGQIIATALGLDQPQLHPGLREGGLGPWQGLTMEEIDAGWPGYRQDNRRPAGAEDPDLVEQRVLSALRQIAASTPGRVLVISHAGCLYALRRSIGLGFIRYGNLCGFNASVDGQSMIRVGTSVALIDAAAPEGL
ncbi:MAG TPA: histidine phosphatase family protein, partial [Ilumatobacteraceae bacterium]|nr:histidine phosphatase family protein [Ilumatobacteraceae bacterium]